MKKQPLRKSGSFVWKLTFEQFFRMLGVFLIMNVFLIALPGSLLFLNLEHTASRLLQTGELADLDNTFIVNDEITLMTDSKPNSGQWALLELTRLENKLGLAEGVWRNFHLNASWLGESPFFWEMRPEYKVTALRHDGGYISVTFALSRFCRQFLSLFILILIFELLLLISNALGFRRTAKRTLEPIQQLTAAAYNISEEHASPSRSPELSQLTGTINTLNQITAKRLDTRLPINNGQTELQGLTEAINSMLDRLDAAYHSQLRFVSDASHELRTPIAVIQGYANLLNRWGKEDPAALQESIEAIKSEAEGMQALVEQLLFLARSDNNSITMEMKPLDISKLAEEVLRDTRLIDQSHTLTSDIVPALWVEGDAGLLKQALRIFMDNAVKYTPVGQSIRVSVSSDGTRVLAAVTDNGIGISEQDLPHVFERFYRSDESRTRATGGSGLGLSIADWTVRRHNGYLEILSRQDFGTKLAMSLPRIAPKNSQE